MSARAIRLRRKAHDLIVGEGQTAVLRNSEGDRNCLVLEDGFSPNQIDGNLIQHGDRMFCLSALNSDLAEIIPPDAHSDRLVIPDPIDESGEIELLLATPPVRICPGNVVIYYELHCREP